LAYLVWRRDGGGGRIRISWAANLMEFSEKTLTLTDIDMAWTGYTKKKSQDEKYIKVR
jgi:hypothetical protein